MLNLTLRFTGSFGTSAIADGPEVLDLTFNGSQRLAVATAYTFQSSRDDELVRHRNTRLRMAARQMGEAVTERVLAELRTMGHNV